MDDIRTTMIQMVNDAADRLEAESTRLAGLEKRLLDDSAVLGVREAELIVREKKVKGREDALKDITKTAADRLAKIKVLEANCEEYEKQARKDAIFTKGLQTQLDTLKGAMTILKE